jgi:hypothetical protein
MTDGLQGERGGRVQSDVREGALQGGHAVGGGQLPALHDGHVVGATDGLHPDVWKEWVFLMDQPFSPLGVYFKVIFWEIFGRRIFSNVLAGIVPVSDEPAIVLGGVFVFQSLGQFGLTTPAVFVNLSKD